MERVFDLNGRDQCVTAKITIADQTFKISRVVTAVRVMYANHLKRMGELLKRTGEVSDNPDDESIKMLKDDVDEFQSDRETLYDQLLSLILSRNGYEYDKTWWQNNTDDTDVRAFIETCLSKDAPSVKKK